MVFKGILPDVGEVLKKLVLVKILISISYSLIHGLSMKVFI